MAFSVAGVREIESEEPDAAEAEGLLQQALRSGLQWKQARAEAEAVEILVESGVVEGVAVDIDLTGALLLRRENGSTDRLVAGEVTGIV